SPLAAGERDIPLRLPQTRAGQQRRRAAAIRQARRTGRGRDRPPQEARPAQVRTDPRGREEVMGSCALRVANCEWADNSAIPVSVAERRHLCSPGLRSGVTDRPNLTQAPKGRHMREEIDVSSLRDSHSLTVRQPRTEVRGYVNVVPPGLIVFAALLFA